MTGSNIFGCSASGTVTGRHCNQGVGNGPEGCDPGNSNQGNPARSNDELGGTPGNPGRKGNTVPVSHVSIVRTAPSHRVVTIAIPRSTKTTLAHGLSAALFASGAHRGLRG